MARKSKPYLPVETSVERYFDGETAVVIEWGDWDRGSGVEGRRLVWGLYWKAMAEFWPAAPVHQRQ